MHLRPASPPREFGPLRAKGHGVRAIRATILLLLLTGCVDNPAGVGVLNVAVEGNVDSTWVGTPGEPLGGAVRVHVTDDEGHPLAGASIGWEVTGRNAQLLRAMEQTDKFGVAEAGWQLGTDAVEDQQLLVTVRAAHKESHVVIHARAVPYIVARLRVALDTPAVVRLGDTLPLRVIAIDPYGNEFPAPEPVLSVDDSTRASALESSVVAGPRRGQTTIHVSSHGVVGTFSLDVVQYVSAILPVIDVLQFSALGAELPVAYEVRDDRGRVVADTTVAIEAANPAVVQVVGGNVRAIAPGATSLRLSLGPASATMLAGVQQRVGSLRLLRDTIRLDALQDTTTLTPIAHDSLGSPIPNPSVGYQLSDAQVARFAGPRTIEALKAGDALVTVRDSATGISSTSNVVVRQVVTAIALNQSAITFDALGDSVSLGATAHDRLGSVVPGTTFEYDVSDTTVVTVDSLNQLHAVGPGQATVSARDTATGVVGTNTVRVDQIATSLTVNVTFDSPIITLPAGSPLPLSCTAVDRNGYPIAREPTFVGSIKGTVTAGECTDATVQRSGYDTIVFAMNGVQARVPVIVATRPDSVGVVAVAQPLTNVDRERYYGENLANPSILALRPLVQEIFAAYGNPTTNLDRARVIRDWVARTAIYPDPWVHPDTTTSNLTVLPPGKTWADLNRVLSPQEWDADAIYWSYQFSDGYLMLDRLLGTLDPATGRRAEDGMMEYVGAARYRIRDLTSYRYLACSYQTTIVSALWAAAGLHGLQASIFAHDPAAVFIPELGRWVYQDVTFNEEYLLDGTGEPLSPTDLLTLSTDGQVSRLHAAKTAGPTFDPGVYLSGRRYLDVVPQGMTFMGAGLYRRVVGTQGAWDARFVQIDVPALATAPAPWSNPNTYVRVTATEAFPTLGVVVEEVSMQDSVYVLRLSSTFPDHQRFERRLIGRDWETAGTTDVLPIGACQVEYRSVDSVGSISATALLNVWAPRTEEFVQSAAPGSLRAQAQYCVSP